MTVIQDHKIQKEIRRRFFDSPTQQWQESKGEKKNHFQSKTLPTFSSFCPLSCLLLCWNLEIFSFKRQVNKQSPAMLGWKVSDYTGRGRFSTPDFPSLTCPARDWVLVWVKRISAKSYSKETRNKTTLSSARQRGRWDPEVRLQESLQTKQTKKT